MNLKPTPRRSVSGDWWAGYVVAIGLTSLTVVLRLALGFHAGDQPYLVLFIIPIAVSAHVGGLWPGLFATAVAAAEAGYFLLRPLHSFATDDVTIPDWMTLLGVGALITIFITLLRVSWLPPDNDGAKTDSIALARRLRRFAQIASAGVFFVGTLVLLGWTLELAVLKSIAPGWPKMSPLTAGSFLLAGFSLWFVAGRQENGMRSRVGMVAALLVALIGGIRLGDHLFGWGLNFDLLGFHEALAAGEAPARMAPATALNFFLLGGALLFARTSRIFGWFQTLVLLGGAISWLGCLRYLYGGEPLLPLGQMALISAVCFVLLTLGIFCSRTDGGLMALFVSDSAGGLLVRRLLPAAVTIPFFVGWARWKAQQAGWFGTEAGIALFGLSNVILFGALIWRNADLLHRADLKIKQADELQLRLAAIVNSSDDAIIGKTLNGIITSWNPGAEKMFGYPAAEAIGKPMLMIFPPNLAHEEAEILARIGRGESVKHFDTVRVRKDGKRINVSITLSPITDKQGKIIGASKIARDITARSEAELALRESEERYRSTLDSMMEGCQLIGFDWRYIYLNKAAAVHNRRPNVELLGKTMMEMWPGIENTGVYALLGHCMAERIALHEETEFIFPDGSKGWFDVRSQPVPEGIFVLSIDITERKQAEAALRESQALYYSLVEQMPAGVFRKDAAGRYVFVNPFFLGIRGASAEQFLGKLPRELPPNEARFVKQATSHHDQIMRTGQPLEVVDEYRHADGRTLFFHVVKSPVFDSEGKITGSQGILFDVTAHKHAEDEVRRLNTELEQRVIDRTAQLEAANKELEAFSYSVSHDLRAPLRAVNGFAGIVLEDFASKLPEEGRRYLERIRNGGQRMGELIDDLLNFSRLSRQPMEQCAVDIVKLVQNVFDDLKPMREEREIEFRIGEMPPCHGDSALLKQVWVNLLSNAIKYSRGRTPAVVEIGCVCEEGTNTYFIRDNGTGFDMQYAHKLFGVFQRLHRADEFEGTGVGLAIVQRIVHRHGGRVWAEAVENHGATFYFTLDGEQKT